VRPRFLLALAIGCAHRPAESTWCADAESSHALAADGASVSLHRHPAPGPPVLVVHGIAANAQYFDLSAERSLAVALNEAGYDAWLLDLRGRGGSKEDSSGRRLRPGWTVDDYGRHDVAAAIDHVRTATGYDQVAYVGHSMGGMVAAVYTAWHGDDKLAALAVLGSPLSFTDPDPVLAFGRRAMVAGSVMGRVPVPAASRATAPLRELPFHGDDMLFNDNNVDEETRQALFRRGTAPMSRGELRQFAGTLAAGTFQSADGSRDYATSLSSLQVPLLVIAGRGDRIAPVDRVWPWMEHAGSASKQWEVLGRANGYRHDYGHVDMTMGIDAPTEVFPLVMEFLNGAVDPKRAPPH
jgi:pimeloyl-ACP methyl ester carboxylesterase